MVVVWMWVFQTNYVQMDFSLGKLGD